MLLAITLMSPGEAMIYFFLSIWILVYFSNKLLAKNPEVKDMAKKAATQKAISLISKWLK